MQPLRRIAALLICQHAAAMRPTRRQALKGTAGSTVMLNFLPGAARAAAKGFGLPSKETNDVVTTVDGIRRKRLGNSDIAVSELALGTQRWGGADFNSPDEELCHQLLDRGVLEGGINLIDTAEQYPIPSDRTRPEGATEEIIGRWLKKGTGRRNKVVLASKITGGRNINKRSIREDCEGSLKRLGVDTLDVYLLHWPARYTPQSNWGQSLEYDWDLGAITVPSAASFREIVGAMGELIKEGSRRSRYRQFKGGHRVDGVPHRQNQRLWGLQRQRGGSHGRAPVQKSSRRPPRHRRVVAHRHVRCRARARRAGAFVHAERLLDRQ